MSQVLRASACRNTIMIWRRHAVAVACAYANLGDSDEAIKWLEREYEGHVEYLVAANGDFGFDAIRSDPRFQCLMRRIGWTKTL